MHIKRIIRRKIECLPIVRKWVWEKTLYNLYKNSNNEEKNDFVKKYKKNFYIQPKEKNKTLQIVKFLNRIDICPVKSNYFFYSIDVFKTLELKYHILDNYSPDYSIVVKGSFKEIRQKLENDNSVFSSNVLALIDTLYQYYLRLEIDKDCNEIQLNAIKSLFEEPAKSFYEGLQRILFFNQFLWQTKHKHNGLGHLDWLLIDLYRQDIREGIITEEMGKKMVKDFFLVLHENCWYKSTMLLGDTGQIIVLGGITDGGKYKCNELTYLFIEISKELKLPDPKILLRCSSTMPNELLELAIECISTGIGAPFLSNDDIVIPALLSFEYDYKDVYNYITSACWEPLIPNTSCDQNNISSINFVTPFIDTLEDNKFERMKSIEDILNLYKLYLQKYLSKMLCKLSKLRFEEEPLLSLLSDCCIEKKKDLVRGGAKYSNLGLTSVGMSTVVNSMMNIQKLVFEEKKYSLAELNNMRKNNFEGQDILVKKLSAPLKGFGCDDDIVIQLVKKIETYTSMEIERYRTKLGGKYKYGLSSPNYITDARQTSATFDGRRNGEPFSVHISSQNTISLTELFSFAMKLDYLGNKVNGNVVDFFVSPSELNNNILKYIVLLKNAFKGGLFQLQINVVDSVTLIAAKNHPEKFPNLVVRVWGFSAYFNDLPDEYKDLLIDRAIKNEVSM